MKGIPTRTSARRRDTPIARLPAFFPAFPKSVFFGPVHRGHKAHNRTSNEFALALGVTSEAVHHNGYSGLQFEAGVPRRRVTLPKSRDLRSGSARASSPIR